MAGIAGIYSIFDTNTELKDVVEAPPESSDDQTVPSPSNSWQLDAGLDENFLIHQQRHVPDQPEQQPAQVSSSSSSSDSDSVRFNATGLFNTGGQLNGNNRGNNSTVSSNVSTGMPSDHPADVTWSGDRQGSNLLTGQHSSSTVLAQLLSTPGGVSAEGMNNSQGTGTISPNKSVEALVEAMECEVCPRVYPRVCPTCGRPL